MFFYRNYRYTTLLWLFFVAVGVFSYTTWMRREGFPTINVPVGVVSVVSFQESADKVDTEFAHPILDIIAEGEHVKTVTASSTDKGANLTIMFKEGTDVEHALSEIEAGVSNLGLPESARIIYIPVNAGKMTNEGDDLLVSVHGEGLTPQELDASSAELASTLNGRSELIERAKSLELLQTAPNFSDGTPTTIQRTFDRFYSEETGTIVPSAIVAVKGVEGVDQLELYDEVASIVESADLSNDKASAAISANFAEGIREQVASLQKNLLEGLLVVLVVSFVLISFRASVITAFAMASTVIITVGILYAIGYTLNTITLFSLVLCLALIVDDTTIIIEAIDKGVRDKKLKLAEVVADSLKRVARASSTGTLVTALAFAPMLFISGILGEFIRAVPITIIVSLFVSLIVSILFIPLMVKFSFRNREPEHKQRKVLVVDRAEKAVGRFFANNIVRFSKTRRSRVVSRISAVFVGTAFLLAGLFILSKVGFNIFPSQKDGNDITIVARVSNLETATVEQTEKIADEVLSTTGQVLGGDFVSVTLTGQNGPASASNFSADVKITDLHKRDITSVEYVDRLNSTFASKDLGATVEARTAGVGPPPSEFTVRLVGDNEEAVRLLASDMQQFLEKEELTRLDGTKATFRDVTISPRNILLRSLDGEFIEVSAMFSDDDTSALVTLAQDSITGEFNSASLTERGLGPSVIAFDLGQEQENQDSFSSMGQAALPLFIVMFVVMALLFRSIIQPLLIFTALPFAVFGVGVGLYLTDNVISFFSMLGVFALIGISLNNTILLTDYANESQKQGLPPDEAMADALQARLRPLLTTSITSFLALLPLALSDPFWEGLAYTLVFGLLSSTLLVILVFPYYYLIAESLRAIPRKLLRK